MSDDIITNFAGVTDSSAAGLTYEEIMKAIDQLSEKGPVFRLMSMPQKTFDQLAAKVGTEADRNPAGIRFQINPYIPEHMVAAYDSKGNLWIIDLRAPDQMRNLGRADSIFDEDLDRPRNPRLDFFRP